VMSSSRCPATRWRKASIAAAHTSLPRPIVNVSPCPSTPASVRRMTVGRGVVRIDVDRVGAGERALRSGSGGREPRDRGSAFACRHGRGRSTRRNCSHRATEAQSHSGSSAA
jgi:hypothetical protein